ncbi:MAG: Uncharacterized protein G01um101419_141 [Parcubacteria group bacterium Gr01-1014_19]|nr:MAG: Uncharacterized protein G01um101419_141 [Parcubacteria group bacterium Gr01-1014_19]
MIEQFVHSFQEITSVESLLTAWRQFLPGKTNKKDVQTFESKFFANILAIFQELSSGTYKHGGYHRFNISDPKPRIIHKAGVRDRLLHHAIHLALYPYFAKRFIADSFSCQANKGTHKALDRFRAVNYRVSKNHTKTCWVLKCDIRKFFASIDHEILLKLLNEHIADKKVVWLLGNVIGSFSSAPGIGLPLGNLTSQLFANVYMNEFDQFVKHKLKVRNYARYADDFVFLSQEKGELEELIPKLREFLTQRLKLDLHPSKIFLKTIASGVDFLGWVHFPDHRVLRSATKRRMIRNMKDNTSESRRQSYLGMLRHGNTNKIKVELEGDPLVLQN